MVIKMVSLISNTLLRFLGTFIFEFRIHKDKHELELVNFYNSLAEFGGFLS
jgi:hypothetical protein